ncbi:alkaline phosphatase D family protein [Thiomicrorhabdus heinhorstiae]|uniref:Alkaline phosphatase D family protein n=1 Tax=Thiomicrorhabdus heinhorstiae TaxID=2748010 RepID=A0ABS0BW36_9GAMM|nr:alkaline phosphatase D family protein [Thiomicrorhabdus heinhorstiae]MBF6057275.1 alkaline phosphatase D family protein [Thiomicrorhabdus heinhorstiae]
MTDKKDFKEFELVQRREYGRRAFLGKSVFFGSAGLPLLSACGGSSESFSGSLQSETADQTDETDNDQQNNDGNQDNDQQDQTTEDTLGPFEAVGAWVYDPDSTNLELSFEQSNFSQESMPREYYVLPVTALYTDMMYWLENADNNYYLLQWIRSDEAQSAAMTGVWRNSYGYLLTLEESGKAILQYSGESTEGDGFCGLNRLAKMPFLQGVASGDPQSDSVVLWSRFSQREEVQINWTVADDPFFEGLVQSGTVTALAENDFCTKVLVNGLQSGKRYYYRFETAEMTDEHNRVLYSLTGRCQTLPSADFSLQQLRLAVVSCASYPHGYFNGYRQVAKHNDLDYVLHLGDYIYEYPGADASADNDYADARAIEDGRTYDEDNRKEIVSLQDYRRRHQHYKEDVDLQLLHSRYAFITTWDDHETADNSWDPDGAGELGGAVNHSPSTEGDWESRKFAAVQAYNEWMPIMTIQDFADPQIYRSFSFGSLAELMLLDTRIQGRHQQANVLTDDYNDAERRLISEAQEAWLKERLSKSNQAGRIWKLIGQQVMMGQLRIPMGSIAMGGADLQALPEAFQDYLQDFQNSDFISNDLQDYQQLLTVSENSQWLNVANTDQWDGYNANRQRIWDHISQHQIDNVVVLTGDIHTSWAMEMVDDPILTTETYGVEFVTTSITSPGLADTQGVLEETLKLYNPHIKYTDLSKHGYLLLTLTESETTAEWYHLEDVLDFDNNQQTLAARYRVQQGSHQLEEFSV